MMKNGSSMINKGTNVKKMSLPDQLPNVLPIVNTSTND
jgi:hypothetical protein